MPYNDFGYEELIRILTDNFSVLADEVQVISYSHRVVVRLLTWMQASLG
jgi:hypothetical protein